MRQLSQLQIIDSAPRGEGGRRKRKEKTKKKDNEKKKKNISFIARGRVPSFPMKSSSHPFPQDTSEVPSVFDLSRLRADKIEQLKNISQNLITNIVCYL